jgi:hypothetical protein
MTTLMVLDVMVSKLNSDRKPGEGALQAMGRIYKNIGFTGLFNGLPVRIIMIGTLTGAQWLIYDSFKVFLGVGCHLQIGDTTVLTIPSCPQPEDTDTSQGQMGSDGVLDWKKGARLESAMGCFMSRSSRPCVDRNVATQLAFPQSLPLSSSEEPCLSFAA